MALFFYEQWTCSLKKCHGASFGNGLKEEVEKHVFFLWMNIKTFRFKESVTLKKRKIKDMGELLAVAMSRGKSHWGKIWAVLASRLMASASGCSLLVCQHKRQGGTWDPSPLFLLSLWGCRTHGAVWGHIWDTVDRLDWDSTIVLGQYFLFAMALQTALTGSNMARTKNEWDNDDYILFCLFSYQCFNEKKENPVSFWYRDIPVFPS